MSRLFPLALGALLILSGCGGDGHHDDTPTPAPTPVVTDRVTVIGDSLSDAGTFGLRYTVQSSDGQPYLLWTDHVTATTAAAPACSYYLASGASFNTRAGCDNYAVAGARIHSPAGDSPLNILVQIQQARAEVGAAGFGANHLLLIDGGGNDAADLIEAYIQLQASALLQPEPDLAAYAAFLSPVLGEADTWALLQSGEQGANAAALAYMQALATQFSTAITQQALAGGAPRVAILNIPDVTYTPRLRRVLDLLTAAVGPEAGPALAQALQAQFQTWITAFNQHLATTFQGRHDVVILDAFTLLGQWVQDSARFGFTNAVNPVCPAQSDWDPIPSYDMAACTDSFLNAHPPAGAGNDWWQQHAFADGFHPTPLGHTVMADAMLAAMQQHGWSVQTR